MSTPRVYLVRYFYSKQLKYFHFLLTFRKKIAYNKSKKILLFKEAIMGAEILTVSSKGQISIPAGIRKNLSIETGDKLIAYASGDAIMLKVLKLPSTEEFEKALAEAQTWAKSAGYKEEDITDIIKSVRKGKK